MDMNILKKYLEDAASFGQDYFYSMSPSYAGNPQILADRHLISVDGVVLFIAGDFHVKNTLPLKGTYFAVLDFTCHENGEKEFRIREALPETVSPLVREILGDYATYRRSNLYVIDAANLEGIADAKIENGRITLLYG